MHPHHFGAKFQKNNLDSCDAALIFGAFYCGYLDIGEVGGRDACVIRYGVDNGVLGL